MATGARLISFEETKGAYPGSQVTIPTISAFLCHPLGNECVDGRETGAPENSLKAAEAKPENTGEYSF